jgi:hypothetical protein
VDADVVGVVSDRERAEGAQLLERVLFHFDLYPRLRCSSQVNYELLGVDRRTGQVSSHSRLMRLLAGRRLALVGPSLLVDWAWWQRLDQLRGMGLDVGLVVGLDDVCELEEAFLELAARRECYEAVLVAGDVPAKPLCARAARELEVVALDIGHALDRLVHPRLAERSPYLKARLEVGAYLRGLASPPPAPAHELEGRLVQVRGDAAVFYVERGMARPLVHRALLELFEQPPERIEREVLEALPRGVPIFVVHERLTGTFVLIDGVKRPVQIGLPFTVLDDLSLEHLSVDSRPVHWYPGAGPGLTTPTTP